MVFNSLQYLIFFPLVLLLYYAVPQRMKNAWLLMASYVFYGLWDVRYCLLLFACTFITYKAALIIDRCRGTQVPSARRTFIATILIALLTLGVFKYTNFIIQNINALLTLSGAQTTLNKTSIVLPVGISFFTFQTVGYLIDVYKGKYGAERSLINFALFVSFFPQILSGPIGRGGDLLPQYKAERKPHIDDLLYGGEHFLWGIFLKLVIADRAAMLVDTVYNDFYSYTGLQIVLATIIYGLQIYADFDGYSHMAIGSARMLGISLPENFDTPYLASSIWEFWRRWHMSLSSWLRDYVYFPLGGSRCSRLRKHVNVMITFLVSGIWHGASWSFVAWGLIHGCYQVAGDILLHIREKLCCALKVNTDTDSFKICRMITTFGLVDFAWLFFRADGFMTALRMCKRILLEFHPLSLMDGKLYQLGLDEKNFRLLLYAALLLLVTDICKYRGIDLKEKFLRQNWLFKEATVVMTILFIVVFGIWGNAYDAAKFIYFQF